MKNPFLRIIKLKIKVGFILLTGALMEVQATDVIHALTAPARITGWGSYSLTVDYTTDVERTITFELVNIQTGKAFGQASLKTAKGLGTLTASLKVEDNPPVGGEYVWNVVLQGATAAVRDRHIAIHHFLKVSRLGSGWDIRVPPGFYVSIYTLDGNLVRQLSAQAGTPSHFKTEAEGPFIVRALDNKGHSMEQLITNR